MWPQGYFPTEYWPFQYWPKEGAPVIEGDPGVVRLSVRTNTAALRTAVARVRLSVSTNDPNDR